MNRFNWIAAKADRRAGVAVYLLAMLLTGVLMLGTPQAAWAIDYAPFNWPAEVMRKINQQDTFNTLPQYKIGKVMLEPVGSRVVKFSGEGTTKLTLDYKMAGKVLVTAVIEDKNGKLITRKKIVVTVK